MSYQTLTLRERSTEISGLAAAMWMSGDYDNCGFEHCIQEAGRCVDALLGDADDWDSAAARQRQQLDDYAADWDAACAEWCDLVDVPSHSRPGLVHTVDVRAGSCTCEAHQFRGRCKHVAEARAAA